MKKISKAKIKLLLDRTKFITKPIKNILLSNKLYLLIFSIGICLILYGSVSFIRIYNEKKQISQQNSKQQLVKGGDIKQISGINNSQPIDPKTSRVCNKYSSDTISKVINESIESQQTGFKDAKTSEGLVSGCVYTIKKSDNQQLRNIQIIARLINNQQIARNNYEKLSSNAHKIDNSKHEAYLLSNETQLLVLDDREIITITLVKHYDKTDTKAILEKLIKEVI